MRELTVAEQSALAKNMKLGERYPVKSKVRIDLVNDDYYSRHEGKTVTVINVDSLGQITCRTEDGYTLTVSPIYGDVITKVEEA